MVTEDDLRHQSPASLARAELEESLGVTHEEVLDRVATRFDESKRERRSQELTWLLCSAFYIGDQYAEVDDEAMRLVSGAKRKVPKYRVRMVVNHVRPAANNLVAQLVRGMPTLTASPASEETEDIYGSLLASAALMHEWRRQEATLLDQDVRLWKTICGTAGLFTRWNETKGSLREGPEGMEPQGDIETIVCSPFTLYPDPGATRMSNSRYFIYATDEDVEGLKEAYPEVADEIAADEERDQGARYERRLRARIGGGAWGGGETPSDTATVIHYWEPRSRDFPDGLMVIATPSVILHMGPNPWAHYRDKWCPIEIFRHHALSASFWGEGAVWDAVPVQKEINKTHSQIIEHRNLSTRGRYWIPRGCKVKAEDMTGEPNEKVWYTPPPPELTGGGRAYRPEREDPPPFPQGHYKLLEILKDKLDDLFSYHPASRGAAPVGVKTGVALETLIEKDEAIQFPIAVRDNLAWEAVGGRWLMLIADQWDEERAVKVRGDEGEVEVHSFRGADIPGSLDVTVEADTLLPNTKTGRINSLLAFVDRNVLTPEQAQEALFGGFGTVRAALHRATAHQRRQRRENQLLLRGVMCEVENYDDHESHLKELNELRISATFERVKDKVVVVRDHAGAPMGVATIAELFERHAAGHAMAMLETGQVPGMGATGLPGQDAMTTGNGPGQYGPATGTARPGVPSGESDSGGG